MVKCYYLSSANVEKTVGNRQLCMDSISESGFFACCKLGHVCMGKSICYDPGAAVANASYYLSSCSDSDYADENCPRYCGDIKRAYQQQFILYNKFINQWSCCGRNCTDNVVVGKNFNAPSPQGLLSMIGQNSTSTSTLSSTSSSEAQVPNGKSLSSQGSLSTSAAAAIGAVVAIASVAILAAIALLIVQWRLRNARPISLIEDDSPHLSEPKTELSSQSPAIGFALSCDAPPPPISAQDPLPSDRFNKSSFLPPPVATYESYRRSMPLPTFELEGPVDHQPAQQQQSGLCQSTATVKQIRRSSGHRVSQSSDHLGHHTSSETASAASTHDADANAEDGFAGIVSPIDDAQERERLI